MKQGLSFILAFLTLTLWGLSANAQIVDPVHWTSEIKMTDDSHGTVVLTARMDAGWHMYSLDVDPTDLVWAEGMTDWVQAQSVDDLREALYGPKDESIPVETAIPSVPHSAVPAPPSAPQPCQQQPCQQPPCRGA